MKRPDSTDRSGALNRRGLLTAGGALGVSLLAGCSAGSGGGSGSGGDGPVGSFRLLVSDQPTAIGDFDELNVSFAMARVFRGEGEQDEADGNETGTETEAPDVTEDEQNATEEGEETEEAEDGEEGFTEIDLDGATVDLTQVVGEKAVSVFEGGLPEGRYSKVELHASDVEGIVDGEQVSVKIPSGKLQIVKPFEVVEGETVSFVFDINVVKKGPRGGYNLLPVISESGVAGEDVEVEEVGDASGGGDTADGGGTPGGQDGEGGRGDGRPASGSTA